MICIFIKKPYWFTDNANSKSSRALQTANKLFELIQSSNYCCTSTAVVDQTEVEVFDVESLSESISAISESLKTEELEVTSRKEAEIG
jgi:hypothetical protein